MSDYAYLSALPEERRASVIAWLESTIGECVACGQPVGITHPHRNEKDGFAHISCESASQTAASSDPESRNVAANARRSDWG